MRRPIIPVGTRSLLFGSHQFAIHPLFVALAWRQLKGEWPRGWRLWLAIICHDWGYWGCRDMDGAEGRMHPAAGARLVAALATLGAPTISEATSLYRFWFWYCAAHSRSYAEWDFGGDCSPLMRPDKLATAMLPRWLYALQTWLTGEYVEYRDYWVRVGGYPGTPQDGPWAYAGHLQRHWRKFREG